MKGRGGNESKNMCEGPTDMDSGKQIDCGGNWLEGSKRENMGATVIE